MSIDCRELRIGNWVEYNGKHYKINALSKELPFLDTYEFGVVVVNHSNLNGIELTPEILEKCGFVKQKDYSFILELGLDGIVIWADDGSVFIGGRREDYGFTSNANLCSSLHQLQNLYFALTGEELQPKL